MKGKLFFILITLFSFQSVLAQDKTIIITESALPYTEQSWFYSGAGNALQGDKIKSSWDEGKRITSVAYSGNGWFVTMAKNTGLTMQTYKQSTSWPQEWIKTNWDDGYYISSLTYGANQWLVVMSKGTNYTGQSYYRDSWSKLKPWLEERKMNGFFITDLAFDGEYWAIVVSISPKLRNQWYLFADSDDALLSKVRSQVYDEGYNVHLMEYGDGEYFVAYGSYSTNNTRSQHYTFRPSDVKTFVQSRWDSSENIAYLGGGKAKTAHKKVEGVPDDAYVSHAGMYGKKRLGRFYYIGKGTIQTVFLEMNNGVYTISAGHAINYKLTEENSDSFIFSGKSFAYYINGRAGGMLPGTVVVSKDWETVTVSGVQGVVMSPEVTKDYYDKCMKSHMQMIGKGIATGQINLNSESEVEKQLKAEIEESQRKIDGINSPLLELFYITIPSMKPQMLFSAVMSFKP